MMALELRLTAEQINSNTFVQDNQIFGSDISKIVKLLIQGDK